MKISEILGYEAIDMHAHLDRGVLGDRTDVIEPWEENVHLCRWEFIKKEYENVGIQYGTMCTFSSVIRTDRIQEENDFLLDGYCIRKISQLKKVEINGDLILAVETISDSSKPILLLRHC